MATSVDSFGNRNFGFKKPQGGGRPFRKAFSEEGKPVSDLRAVLAKKQASNISDLREKLKPKALYTSKLASRNPKSPPATNGTSSKSPAGRKQLKLTPSFKNSVSSAVSGSSSAPAKSSRGGSSRSSSSSTPHRSRSSSYKLPTYEEAKKISVTVPGLSRPVSEYPSHRREERLAAQIARSKESRQDTYMRGREEFLASAITSAGGSFGGGSHGSGHGSGHGVSHGSHSGAHSSGDRDRTSMGIFAGRSAPRGYSSRSPSPGSYPDYGGSSSFDPLYSLGGFHHKTAPPPPLPPASSSSYSSGSRSQRGITTATSMIISNLSDTVSKNDVAELCSVVGSLDGVYMHAPGIAEVVFKYKDDALEAYKKYNQRNLDGQPMHCKLQPASRSRLSGTSYGHSYADEYYPHSGSGFY